MKVYISFKISNKPAGGGNNFLKFLSQELASKGFLTCNPEKADLILINSHHNLFHNIYLKLKYPNTIFIHRMDGRLSLHRNIAEWDKLVMFQNRFISNVTIFQSEWSKKIWNKSIEINNFTIIKNQANNKIFRPRTRKKPNNTTVIALSSWSNNKNKDNNFIDWLHNNRQKLDISLLILGNFGDKKTKSKLSQQQINKFFTEAHIFCSPSKYDACSNAILEAQATGLPLLILNSGGNPEIISNSGILFRNRKELVSGLNKIRNNYEEFNLNAIKASRANQSISEYIKYFEELIAGKSKYLKKIGVYKVTFNIFKILLIVLLIRIKEFYSNWRSLLALRTLLNSSR